ncbi:MAG: type 1 glutamine amidotransferase [Rhodobacteraceae bacterium]|nr:type 1 glutamine amidotransferase [Paracoccaceae bacterium]
MKILIIESNPPDLLARGFSDGQPYVDTFAALGLDLDLTLVEPYRTPFDPELLDGADGVIFSGSGVEWSTADARAEPLARAMRACFETGVPVFGSCNGMQLAACVLGGYVDASPNGREQGVAQGLTLTEAGRAHPLMYGRDNGFGALTIHRDEVTKLPAGAVVLARNAHCDVQAFAYDRDGVDFWGVEYHPEYSPEFLGAMLDDPRHEGAFADMAADLRAARDTAEAADRLGTTTEDMQTEARATELTNWLAHVKARKDGS